MPGQDEKKLPRGIALIICNTTFDRGKTRADDRPGAKEDSKMLVDAFETLGFEVKSFMDLTSTGILKEAKKVSRKVDAAHECLVVALSTHGGTEESISEDDCGIEGYTFVDEVDLLYGTDGPLEFGQLTAVFNEKNCPSLKGKPKLFFLQACRGNELAQSITVKGTKDPSGSAHRMDTAEQDKNVEHSLDNAAIAIQRPVELPTHPEPKSMPMETNIPATNGLSNGTLHMETEITNGGDEPVQEIEKIVTKKVVISRDYLTMWASPPGHFAFHTDMGSPFIRRLTGVLREKHNEADLLSMLTEVNHKVATEYQMQSKEAHLNERRTVPSIEHMLRKPIFFKTTQEAL